MTKKNRSNSQPPRSDYSNTKAASTNTNTAPFNNQKLETLANEALINTTASQLEQIKPAPPPTNFNINDCWKKAQLFENAIKNIVQEREQIETKEKQLDSRIVNIKEQEEAFQVEKTNFKQEKQQLEADRQALKRERQSLDAQIQSLTNKERQIQERELNAEAGFITQNQAALRELEKATINLRQERDRLYKEITERRLSLDTELAERQELLEVELNSKRQKYEEELKIQQEKIEAEKQELIALHKEVRREKRQLQAERELLQEDQEAIELKIQLESAATIEKLKVKIQILEEQLRSSQELRANFEKKLLQRAEADRRFGNRTPDQVLADLESLQVENEDLKQKLAAQPSQANLERLQVLESEKEQWESERLQLKTRVQEQERSVSLNRIEVSNLETLRNEKEALEASNSRLQQALKELRNDLALSMADHEKRSQFEHCALMDTDNHLQTDTPLTREILDLRLFAEDLRHRIAIAQGKGKELYYSKQDIRAFLAGLAMSRLHILQGISGTGKTSLPSAFARAVGDAKASNCKLIEVQAGWRDRQDLIGYFNAFEGRFYETDFLKAIYEAQTPLYKDQIYIILLDEMNLSRPEQYFADFLSKLEQAESGKSPTLGLISDPKKSFPNLFKDKELPIPPNIWFIGTANQDETTLEFADKTYDRAHIMELHQQSESFKIENPEARHPVAFSALMASFNKAFKDHKQAADETWKFLNKQELRSLLKPFKLGWGNRLRRQVDRFVPVIVAAGGTTGEATDHIFATKILRKLRDRHDTPIDDLKRLQDYLLNTFDSYVPEQSLTILDEEIHRLSGGEYL